MRNEIIKQYEESDVNGKYRCKQYRNGIITRALFEPSKQYKEKQEKIKVLSQKKKIEFEEKQRKEKLIKDKMRELAIQQLEKEGKL